MPMAQLSGMVFVAHAVFTTPKWLQAVRIARLVPIPVDAHTEAQGFDHRRS